MMEKLNAPEYSLFLYVATNRGLFINQVAFIEKKIEFFIAYHFTNNIERAHEMIELLTGDRFVSFESKRTAFENILERHHNAIFKSNKDMFQMLTTIQNERNKLAHLMVDTSPNAVELYKQEQTFYLLKFSKDTKPIPYSLTKMKALTEKVDQVANWVDLLLRDYLKHNETPS